MQFVKFFNKNKFLCYCYNIILQGDFMENILNIVLYHDGELELKVSLNEETIWLSQDEISLLFNVDRTSVTRHINKILKDNEVEENSNVQKMHFANSDKPVKIYSLDIILAVGYRTNSSKAIKIIQL